MIHTLTQGHFLPMVAPAAILRCVGRVDFDKRSASFFRFARQSVKKSCPRGIMNAFRETMVMRHTVDMQVFHADDAEAINNLPGLLMREVIPSERYPFMHAGNSLAMFPAFRRSLCQFTMLALDTGQGLLFFTKKAGIGYLFFITKSSKGFESNINANLGRGFWQAFRLTLDREGNIPFARATSLNSTGFQFALDRPMIDHLDTSNLGKRHTIIMGDIETTLREGETIVAVTATKTGIARIFTCFATSKERFESQINANGYILQHLRMDLFQCRAFLFQQSQRINLIIAREGLSFLHIGCLAFLKKMVVEPTTLIKGFVQLVNLFLRGKDTVLKHFMHTLILAQSRTYINSFSPAAASAPYIPMAKARGLTARIDKYKVALRSTYDKSKSATTKTLST
jgi:hypothetical protein